MMVHIKFVGISAEEVLTEIGNPNIVLEKLTSQADYFEKKPAEKVVKLKEILLKAEEEGF
jgi:hypothetical protein